MANKKFPIFLHAGRGNGKGESSLQFSINSIMTSSGLKKAIASIAQSAERQTMDPKFGVTNPAISFILHLSFFQIFKTD